MAKARKATKEDLKISQFFEIDPTKHKQKQKIQKLHNKGTRTDNEAEKDTFLNRTGPRLPLAKRKTKNKTS